MVIPRSVLFSRGARARVKAINICLITPQQTIYDLRTRNVRTRFYTQMHNWLDSRWVKRRLVTACRVIVVGLSHCNWCTITRPPSSKTKTYRGTCSKPMKRQNICMGCYKKNCVISSVHHDLHQGHAQKNTRWLVQFNNVVPQANDLFPCGQRYFEKHFIKMFHWDNMLITCS